MAKGFVPYLLQHLKVLAGQNYNGYKITPSGFLKALVQNDPQLRAIGANGERIDPLALSTRAGNIRQVKLKYLPRITPSQIDDSDNCDNNQQFVYTESDITAPFFSKFSFYLSWEDVERYEAAAAQAVQTGNPRITILEEVLDQIKHSVNGLVGKMDQNLLGGVTWGTNVVSGNNTAQAININKDGRVFDLSNGVLEILSDYQQNELMGTPIIVGGGLMNKFQIAKGNAAVALAASGMNLGALSEYKWYFDIYSQTSWGANNIGVFAPGTIGFVDVDRYIAWKTGRFGTSIFGQIELPIETAEGMVVMMPFNIQVKEVDCPTEIFNGYETVTVDRGYQIILTKNYGLWQLPTDSVQASDRINGVNGALRYTISNDCDSCNA